MVVNGILFGVTTPSKQRCNTQIITDLNALIHMVGRQIQFGIGNNNSCPFNKSDIN